MKRQALYRLFFLVAFCACQKKHETPLPVIKTPEYQKAVSLVDKEPDSAFFYFNVVTSISKDSLEVAMAFNQMAAIQSDAGDYFGAQESLTRSLRFLKEGRKRDRKCLSSDYNELGMASYNLKNFTEAVSFFDRAIAHADNPQFRAVILNNAANAYRKNHNYRRALLIYQGVLASAGRDSLAYARVLTNMTVARWLWHPMYDAAPELRKALRIRQQAKDAWGENSSYAHLADFYTGAHTDSALFYARMMYTVAQRLQSADDELEALQKLIRLSQPENAKTYFLKYQRLDDSIQAVRNSAKNQFALIRYDAEKEKADNLRLQKDNAAEHYGIVRRNAVISAMIFLLVAGSWIGVVWYHKRRHRMELESRNAINEDRLKISRKVHDVVANDLYRLMNEVEYEPQINREKLLDRIEGMYERSRNISHEPPARPEENFPEKIRSLLGSFSGPVRVAVTGNDQAFWDRIGLPARNELELILQELMVNMKKHSQASNAGIRFEQNGNKCAIHYKDDGIGMVGEIRYGNGLRNTGNRIKTLHGEITFEMQPGKGLQVHLSFPATNT